jgi:hypothetical protein
MNAEELKKLLGTIGGLLIGFIIIALIILLLNGCSQQIYEPFAGRTNNIPIKRLT